MADLGTFYLYGAYDPVIGGAVSNSGESGGFFFQ